MVTSLMFRLFCCSLRSRSRAESFATALLVNVKLNLISAAVTGKRLLMVVGPRFSLTTSAHLDQASRQVNEREKSRASFETALETLRVIGDLDPHQLADQQQRHRPMSPHRLAGDSQALSHSQSTQTEPVDQSSSSDADEDAEEVGPDEALLHEVSRPRRRYAVTSKFRCCYEKLSDGTEFLQQLMPTEAEEEENEGEAENGSSGRIDDSAENVYEVIGHPSRSKVRYEEVLLRRSSSQQKLGLTLCYGSGDDTDTDIFVSEVEPTGVAGKDGRIKAGDQILEINGVDVHTRNEAVNLFHQQRHDVALFVAHHSAETVLQLIEEEGEEAFSDGTHGSGYSVLEKDSGISRATDSEVDLPPPPVSSLSKYSDISTDSQSPEPANTATMATAKIDPRLDTVVDRDQLKSQPVYVYDCVDDVNRPPREEKEVQVSIDSTGCYRDELSLDRELQHLQEEMEHVQLECDRLIAEHADAERKVRKQMQHASELEAVIDSFQQRQSGVVGSCDRTALVPSTFAPAIPLSLLNDRSSRTTTKLAPSRNSNWHLAGWNAGNGKVPTPLFCKPAPADGCLPVTRATVVRPSQENKEEKRDSAFFSLSHSETEAKMWTRVAGPSSTSAPGLVQIPKKTTADRRATALTVSKMAASNTDLNISPTKAAMSFPKAPCCTMLTNPENLHSTILLQQKLLRENVVKHSHVPSAKWPPGYVAVNQKASPGSSIQQKHQNTVFTPAGSNSNCSNSDTNKMEWKVKRRPDGSRYITKRPVKNKILKERAERLSKERLGVTTDDDAVSELKLGRYWTKEERKRHLEKAKERRRRQEELLKRKLTLMQQANEQPILQLVHKKMLRKKRQQLLDPFITIQELLTHGSRTIERCQAMGILSVTTV